jgi:UDP-N-acetylmuramyl pentapeptide phosphotransferase/UDP-N-acetylglucosamine-1-phosphate transferase
MDNTFLNILTLIGGFAISVITEMIILPRIILIAKKRRLLDMPDHRKKHDRPIPRLGGTTFMFNILLVSSFLIFMRVALGLGNEMFIRMIFPEWMLFLCGMCLIYLVGIKDDLIGVGFNKKFFIQFVASLCIVGSGVYLTNLHGLFGVHEISAFIGIPLSILIIIFLTNAINLIDGADGLASGLSAIAFFVYGMLFSLFGLWTYAGIAFIIMGILTVFFYYNFIHPSRKIFMGDTGSLTLGYILSFMMLSLARVSSGEVVTTLSGWIIKTQVIVPTGFILLLVAALFIPPADAFRVMVGRMLTKQHPFSPDRSHIHHKLLELGLSRRQTVFTLIVSGIVIFCLNLILLYLIDCNLVLFIDVVVWLGSTYLVYWLIGKKGTAHSKTTPAE